MNIKKIKSFTLIEVILVVVILAALTGLAVVKHHELIELQLAKTAVINLRAIASGEKIYYAKNGHYWPLGNTIQDIAVINASLSLNILQDSRLSYECSDNVGGGVTFFCSVQEATHPWELRINTSYNNNLELCCFSGDCALLSKVSVSACP